MRRGQGRLAFLQSITSAGKSVQAATKRPAEEIFEGVFLLVETNVIIFYQ